LLGGRELEVGEQLQKFPIRFLLKQFLSYIGAANESDSCIQTLPTLLVHQLPIFTLTDSENLTLGQLKRLEHRDDVIPRVRAIDIVSSSLPTGSFCSLLTGKFLLMVIMYFLVNPAIEGLYKVSGTGRYCNCF
jgi:hypothetical protein